LGILPKKAVIFKTACTDLGVQKNLTEIQRRLHWCFVLRRNAEGCSTKLRAVQWRLRLGPHAAAFSLLP
jgi:hypothetical protein